MLVFITDEDVSREIELRASDVFGNECTEELLLSIVSDKFRECGGEYALEPHDYRTRYLYKMNDETKRYFNSTAVYAMNREFYRMFSGLIKEWHTLVRRINNNPRDEKMICSQIAENDYPPVLLKHLYRY